jgi:hypothetical protein
MLSHDGKNIHFQFASHDVAAGEIGVVENRADQRSVSKC